MWDIIEIKKYLKENLLENRYKHTLGVVETSIILAKKNNVDVKKAEIAAMAHDVAKNMTIDNMKKIIDENNIELSYYEWQTPELWHSIIGPILAKKVFNIEDEEILSAIRWHTTGKENMSTLEKIIYVADMIEPGRNYLGVDKLRVETFNNLNKGVLMAMNHTIKYLLEKGFPIEINSIKARNYMILNNVQ